MVSRLARNFMTTKMDTAATTADVRTTIKTTANELVRTAQRTRFPCFQTRGRFATNSSMTWHIIFIQISSVTPALQGVLIHLSITSPNYFRKSKPSTPVKPAIVT